MTTETARKLPFISHTRLAALLVKETSVMDPEDVPGLMAVIVAESGDSTNRNAAVTALCAFDWTEETARAAVAALRATDGGRRAASYLAEALARAENDACDAEIKAAITDALGYAGIDAKTVAGVMFTPDTFYDDGPGYNEQATVIYLDGGEEERDDFGTAGELLRMRYGTVGEDAAIGYLPNFRKDGAMIAHASGGEGEMAAAIRKATGAATLLEFHLSQLAHSVYVHLCGYDARFKARDGVIKRVVFPAMPVRQDSDGLVHLFNGVILPATFGDDVNNRLSAIARENGGAFPGVVVDYPAQTATVGSFDAETVGAAA